MFTNEAVIMDNEEKYPTNSSRRPGRQTHWNELFSNLDNFDLSY